ncbi:hypothetical protein HDU87_008115 [Geranomyces variabilis]|uniref:Pre-mRNA-processing factor 19 n=1 Tax=Geranomyces variabilis TaxID=109894 RepID=A0AAD5TPZ8_9FUNG|nr:hypothetical protein HDU87_008115 [Geranomyces variabilis]
MFCALSGESPEEPVVSKVSGSVFEKRLILKFITDNGRDPVSGEELTVDDLLPLKLTNKFIKPRPPAASSIPNLLMSLQNEWDSVMLETYQLKQQYHTARQELSNALYENDAAKRVIARIMVERDEARAALAAVQAAYPAPGPESSDSNEMDVDEAPQFSVDMVAALEKMEETAADLHQQRRKRKVPATCATADEVTAYTQLLAINAPKAHTALAVDLAQPTVAGEKQDWILTGGNGGKVKILDRSNDGKAVASINAGKSIIRDVAWIDKEGSSPAFLTAGDDKIVRLFEVEHPNDTSFGISKAKETWNKHTKAVLAIKVHPTKEHFVSASSDASWAVHNIATGQTLNRYIHSDTRTAFHSLDIHPDGMIFATGCSDTVVRLWDMKSQSSATDFVGHLGGGNITGVSFSENGYHLATCSDAEAVVRIWDLRKMTNLRTIEIEAAKAKGCTAVRFDYSGQFFGVACGDELRTYRIKQWDQLCNLAGHTSEVASFKFGTDSKYIVSGGRKGEILVNGVAPA